VLYQSISFNVRDVTNIGKCFSYQDLLLNQYIMIVQLPAYLVIYEIPVVAVMSSDIFFIRLCRVLTVPDILKVF
jgi:hypothetical protein